MDREAVGATLMALACADLEGSSDRDLVDLLRGVEELKAAAAGLQARAAARLRSRELEAHGDGGEGRESSITRSVGAQVGLARRESPHRGRELTGFAAMLVADLPYTLAALCLGQISERRALIVAGELTDLDAAQRAVVDERLAKDPRVLDGLGDLKVRHAVRREVYRIDAEAAVRRREKARRGRNVSCRRGWASGAQSGMGRSRGGWRTLRPRRS